MLSSTSPSPPLRPAQVRTFFLGADIIRYILAKIPLSDFQRIYREERNKRLLHLLTFNHRYLLRYSQALPVAPKNYRLKTEEEQKFDLI